MFAEKVFEGVTGSKKEEYVRDKKLKEWKREDSREW